MEYPDSYNMLKYKYRVFIDCYINDGLIEPTMHKPTFNDEFVSYVFAFNKGRECGEAFDLKYYETDNFGNVSPVSEWHYGCKVQVTVKNVAKFISLQKCARKVHSECVKAINDIRTMMYSSDDKSKELELKDAIYNSSLHADDSKDRNDNRKMMMKIMGLDQIKVDTSVDIYQASGKQILARLRSEGGNGDEPIIPMDIDDIDDNSDSEK